MSTEDGHDHHHPRPDSQVALRARALEALLVEKGLVATDAIDAVVELYERDVGPQNGARWWRAPGPTPPTASGCSPTAPTAIAELGFGGAEGDNMVVGREHPDVHNVVVCTLCSCYPWPVLGLPPTWYKSAAVPRPRGGRAARGAARVRPGAARRGRDPGLGLHRRGALPRRCRCGPPAPRA